MKVAGILLKTMVFWNYDGKRLERNGIKNGEKHRKNAVLAKAFTKWKSRSKAKSYGRQRQPK